MSRTPSTSPDREAAPLQFLEDLVHLDALLVSAITQAHQSPGALERSKFYLRAARDLLSIVLARPAIRKYAVLADGDGEVRFPADTPILVHAGLWQLFLRCDAPDWRRTEPAYSRAVAGDPASLRHFLQPLLRYQVVCGDEVLDRLPAPVEGGSHA